MQREIERIQALENEMRAMAGALRDLESQKQHAQRSARRWRGVAGIGILVGLLVAAPVGVTAQAGEPLEDRVAALEGKLQYLTVDGTEMYITGANLNLRNGLGATNGQPDDPVFGAPVVNGLGNLIIGYDELRNDGYDERTGSHNLVVGPLNNRTSFGGLVAGSANAITGMSCAALGMGNTASGNWASVTGGCWGQATGSSSTVSGGYGNSATGGSSAVSGGGYNVASSSACAVAGGQNNTAQGMFAAVSGGRSNHANGEDSSVSGGYVNYASNFCASVSGGNNNVASGGSSSVSGGSNRSVSGGWNWRGGSFFSAN